MQKSFNFINIIFWTFFIVFAINVNSRILNSKEVILEKDTVFITDTIKDTIPKFLTSDNPKEGLFDALKYYDISHPEIVYAQAILETGHFSSYICKNYNNLFGLYNSNKKDYYKFKHWSESVIAYKKYIQRRYKPNEDYYNFLVRINYAEDPMYITKLKQIVNYDKGRD